MSALTSSGHLRAVTRHWVGHVVKIQETTLASDYPNRLGLQYALALACQANGQVKEAIALLEHVVKIRWTILAPGHPDRLALEHTLSYFYNKSDSKS